MCAVQLPGRERRLGESPRSNLGELVDEIASGFQATDIPFAMLGVSMGAWIAYELALNLRERGLPQPFHLFIGASAAPHVPDHANEHMMSLDAWIEHARALGELTDEELEARELLELMFPVLVADAALTETHTHRERPPLACAISAYAAANDRRVLAQDVRAWDRYTTGTFEYRELPGEHNFLKTAPEPFVQAVAAALAA